MPGVLPRTPMAVQRGRVVLTLPSDLASLNSDRLQTRLRQFARLLGGDPEVRDHVQQLRHTVFGGFGFRPRTMATADPGGIIVR